MLLVRSLVTEARGVTHTEDLPSMLWVQFIMCCLIIASLI